MKITITDTSWGIDRRTGNRSERVVACETFELAVGFLPEIGPAKRAFEVTKLTENSVTILLNIKGDTTTIKRGGQYFYRPMSMDGGHYYLLEVE